FEIQGIDPTIESEPEYETDPDYDFDDMDGFDTVESELRSLEMEGSEFLDEVSPDNPYEAPRADLTPEDDFSSKSNFVYPQKLPAKNGLSWLIEGFALFKKSPFKWLTSVFVFFLVTMVASLIPFLGAIATNLFNPVFMAGFMIGAKEQTEGGNFRMGHVFAGFSNNAGQLILFGLLYLIATLAIFGLMVIIGAAVFIFMSPGSMNFFDPAIISKLANISPLFFLLFVLVIMLITIPIMMAYYFGPALISINQASVFNAAKMSFKACLSNMFPFLLYGLACMGILILVGLIIGGITVLLGFLLDQIGIFVGIAGTIILMFAVTPVFFASTYVAYKDIFYIK
ncbi:MAG: DUF2189 domain-containing protein, partial [Desulfobacteraceae bacterium]|nr:DUF2189 domain-containing protein [Desulfobacteraceae bacterium]